MHNPSPKFRTWLNLILQRIVKQNFLGLLIFLRLLQVFHDRMNPDCDDRVWLSKSDKNIGVGGWWVGNIFEAAYSGDVLAHPRITIVNTHPEQWAAIYAALQ